MGRGGPTNCLIGLFLGAVWGQCACDPRCSPPPAPTPWPLRVHSYQFGSSQTFGQSPAYFPYNVLGEICKQATPTTPCSDPCQVVSLGKGGYIALEFSPPIADGPGADFIVFENAFLYGDGGGQVFDEWMIVEVSQDGESWHTFPFDSLTGEGLAGRTPTGCSSCSGPIHWQDPTQAGGDAFDLAQVGQPWARYVRVRDATHWQRPDRLSADLDGIVAIHQLTSQALSSPLSPVFSKGGQLFLRERPVSIYAWDFLGRSVPFHLTQEGPSLWSLRVEGPGVVIIQGVSFVWRGPAGFP
jgi:hypothetical protein